MLQPRTYPELLGKALVLDAEPFITMADDDNPWVEGLFLTTCVGLLIGLAQLLGGWLTAAAYPHPDAILALLLQSWQQLNPGPLIGDDPAAAEAIIRQSWGWLTQLSGWTPGWRQLFILVLAPLALITQWLLHGIISHGMALRMGGRGSLNQMLGTSALMAAPFLLYLFSVIPAVDVGGPLLAVWATLIVYRALEVAHDLSWQKAAVAAAVPLLLMLVLVLVVFITLGFAWGGA